MKNFRKSVLPILVGICVGLGTLTIPQESYAGLYKYKTPSGDVLITTEARPEYELIEVISGPHPSKGSSSSKRSASSKTAKKSTPKPRRKAQKKRYDEDDFDDIIREASEAYDVPFAFIKAVIRIESHFQPAAVSHAGAMGLMQLMPRTAESLNVTDAFDPRQNIFGGAKFLRILIDRYDGDINLILAAYNAGDAAVARYDGIPYAKTRDYVASVYFWYKEYSEERASD
ncbi:MAG: lytic transglycosylase domain-containing protein [Myxococcota bacterium]